MATDQGPVVQSALLRGELIRLRKDNGLTQEHVAEELEWSPSKLIRIEGGRSQVTKTDLDALLSVYRVPEDRREQLQAMNRGARERAWWDAYKDDVAPAYLNYVGLEAGAAVIRQFQLGFIPGLLQTAEYARAVTVVGSVDPGKIEPVVDLRRRRQSELARRSKPPRQHFVVDEGVIRRHVGIETDRTIMPKQLRSVADRAEQDELITVRVIPFRTGAHPGLFGPFTLLEFAGGLPDVLYLDPGRGVFTMIAGDDPQVAAYADDFENLLQDALSPQASIEIIRGAADEMS